ncbi:MAG: hypothetical protein BGO40_02895 [Chryseobacterium sp. 39-10]|nr:hypothetical protein [Chryseobacterium sp.]OJV46526.1 MAG: hypothetical protein BGO40_02895 [Chryseobacterium sp. 39-10]
MLAKLQNDTFVFSGLRTHAQLLEASTMLMEDGKIRGFDAFAKDFNQVNTKYNQNYLEAEWQFAVSSSQSAGNWAAIDQDGRYNLQYRTANDDRVRADHAALQNITLPTDDPFWISYYPPNGWRCRCVAVEVLKTKYELSDSVKANEAGDRATTKIGPDGKNRSAIFRFNPGMEQKVFPPKHPYNKLKGAEEVKMAIKEIAPLSSTEDLSKHVQNYATENPEMFQRGYKKIMPTRAVDENGSTDGNGTIKLQQHIIDNVNAAINNIKTGKPTTLQQETALSTLHHEIWHNANKHGVYPHIPTKAEVKTMELANEFVARKTLPQFMEKIGGKLHNTELTENRPNTGYNTMVRNYDHLIKWSKADPNNVLETVKNNLINENLKSQKAGLVDGIIKNSEFKFKKATMQKIIKYAEDLPEDRFMALLEANGKLLTGNKSGK